MTTLRIPAVLAAMIYVTSATAVDYTLNIPVNVSNIDPNRIPNINCYLMCVSSNCSSAGAGVMHGGPGSRPGTVAAASKPLSLSNSAYSGTVQVVFSLTEGQVAYAERYLCEFALGKDRWVGGVKPNSNSVLKIEGNVQ